MASNLLPMLPVYSVTYPAGSYRSTGEPNSKFKIEDRRAIQSLPNALCKLDYQKTRRLPCKLESHEIIIAYEYGAPKSIRARRYCVDEIWCRDGRIHQLRDEDRINHVVGRS